MRKRFNLDELGKYFVEVGFLFPASLLQARLSQARGEYVQAQESLQKLLACWPEAAPTQRLRRSWWSRSIRSQSIYRKLGVKSRWEASEAAHSLNLL